jgi:hypothetical protein
MNELMNDKEIYSQQSRGKGPVERIEGGDEEEEGS